MTTFTEADHPRVRGKFTDKPATAPEGELVPAPVDLRIGDFDYGSPLSPYDFDSPSFHSQTQLERLDAIGRMNGDQHLSLLASDDPDVLGAIAEHTRDKDILAFLASHGERDVRMSVKRVSDDAELLEMAAAGDRKQNESEAAVRATQRTITPVTEDIEDFVLTPAQQAHEDQVKAAADKNATAEELAEFAKIDNVYVQSAVADNPNTSTATLLSLVAADRTVAYRAVAGRQDCPVELLDELSSTKYEAIRKAVAGNTSASAKSLRKLAKDYDNDVREAVAYNPRAPKSALKILFDGSGSVASTHAHHRLTGRA